MACSTHVDEMVRRDLQGLPSKRKRSTSERANSQEPPLKISKVKVKTTKSPRKRKSPDTSRTPQQTSPSLDGSRTSKLPKKLDMRIVDGSFRRTAEGDAAFRADFAYLCDDFVPEGHGGGAAFDTVKQAKQAKQAKQTTMPTSSAMSVVEKSQVWGGWALRGASLAESKAETGIVRRQNGCGDQSVVGSSAVVAG